MIGCHIADAIFNEFPCMKIVIFYSSAVKYVSKGPIYKYISSANGWVSNKRQPLIGIITDLVYRRIYASLGLNKLRTEA